MKNEIVSNIFGIIGSIIWSVQLVPQIRLNYQRKSTKGLSPYCFASWYLCGLILGSYLIHENRPFTLIVQILLFSSFCLVTIFQHFLYEKLIAYKQLAIWFCGTLVVSCGVGAVIYEVMSAVGQGNKTISIVVSLLSLVFMVLGFVPQLMEIYHCKSSAGISKIFVVMDAFGGIASILSLVFDSPFDYYAFATYVVVPIFQAVMMAMLVYYDRHGPNAHLALSDDEESNTNTGIAMQETQKSSSSSPKEVFNPSILYTSLSASTDPNYSGNQSPGSGSFANPANTSVEMIRSSYIITQQTPADQEFDHILPESESDSDEAVRRQTTVLNQSSSLYIAV